METPPSMAGEIMKRSTIEDRYYESIHKQQRLLNEFVLHETEWAENLFIWYKYKKLEVPDDEYRGAAYFMNSEYKIKPGSLTLLYETYLRCEDEMPKITKESAFDSLRYRYRLYAVVLTKGGF